MKLERNTTFEQKCKIQHKYLRNQFSFTNFTKIWTLYIKPAIWYMDAIYSLLQAHTEGVREGSYEPPI